MECDYSFIVYQYIMCLLMHRYRPREDLDHSFDLCESESASMNLPGCNVVRVFYL